MNIRFGVNSDGMAVMNITTNGKLLHDLGPEWMVNKQISTSNWGRNKSCIYYDNQFIQSTILLMVGGRQDRRIQTVFYHSNYSVTTLYKLSCRQTEMER